MGEFNGGLFILIKIQSKTKNKDKAMLFANYEPEVTCWVRKVFTQAWEFNCGLIEFILTIKNQTKTRFLAENIEWDILWPKVTIFA